jgi:hypothetical protein
MFTPVDQNIKDKIISAHLDGLGRNQITRALHEEGIKVSHGSVSNIIIKYKRQNEQSVQPDTQMNNTSVVQPQQPLQPSQLSQSQISPRPSPPNDAGISAGIPINNIGSPSLTASGRPGVRLATKNNTNVTPRDGGPLSLFIHLGEDDSTEESNLQSPTPKPDSLPSSGLIKDPETEMQVTTLQPQQEQKELVANVEELAPEVPEAESEIERRLDQEKAEWPNFGPGWTRVLEQIRKEKGQRHHDLLVIDRRKEKILEWENKAIRF